MVNENIRVESEMQDWPYKPPPQICKTTVGHLDSNSDWWMIFQKSAFKTQKIMLTWPRFLEMMI